jgi:hypothetical protein
MNTHQVPSLSQALDGIREYDRKSLPTQKLHSSRKDKKYNNHIKIKQYIIQLIKVTGVWLEMSGASI